MAADRDAQRIKYPLPKSDGEPSWITLRRRQAASDKVANKLIIFICASLSLWMVYTHYSTEDYYTTIEKGFSRAVAKHFPQQANRTTQGNEINFGIYSGKPQSSSDQLLRHTQNDLNVTKRPVCEPVNLIGRMVVSQSAPPMSTIEAQLSDSGLQLGGHFKPKNCLPQDKVAIVVPYRDREEHLRPFLQHLHPVLMRQGIEYQIFLVEQAGSEPFNRGTLSNVGFLEAGKLFADFGCIIVHDIDLLPEDDRNLYRCPEPLKPRHMSASIDSHNYTLFYETLFGGVSALTREQFETVNGFSNVYWGWGAEDDDLSYRLSVYNYSIARYDLQIARYTMLKHKKAEPSPDRLAKYNSGPLRLKTDGLNSVLYDVLEITLKKLYTRILVDIGVEKPLY